MNDNEIIKALEGQVKCMELKVARAEAIKEFAERLKQCLICVLLSKSIAPFKPIYKTEEIAYEAVIECIDNLVKEMVCADV